MSDIPQFIRDSWAKGSPTDWFEQVYGKARDGEMNVPWAHMQPNAELMEFLDEQSIDGSGKRALVIGCGLGDDAQGLAQHGFDVTAFDVSESAIQWCNERFPDLNIDFQVANLLDPPDEWQGAFDFVFENRTIQSLPYPLHPQVISNIAAFVRSSGTLLVNCHGRNPDEPANGIPWPLSRDELQQFHQHHLTEQSFKDFSKNGLRRFLVEYRSNLR